MSKHVELREGHIRGHLQVDFGILGHTHLGSIPGGHLQVETAVAAVFLHSLSLFFKLPLDDFGLKLIILRRK